MSIMTPSDPNAVRPAAKMVSFSVAEQWRISPLASNRRNPATCEEKLPRETPVPCVPVPTTPPRVWRSISPMLKRARPKECNCGPTSHSRVAAPNVAMFFSGSKPFSPLNADRSISVPSVAFNGVKECPVPGTRTGPLPCRTAAARATSSLGATISLGLQMTPPDQFDHLPPTIFMKGAALRRQFEMPSDVGEFWGALLQIVVHAFLEVWPLETGGHLGIGRH